MRNLNLKHVAPVFKNIKCPTNANFKIQAVTVLNIHQISKKLEHSWTVFVSHFAHWNANKLSMQKIESFSELLPVVASRSPYPLLEYRGFDELVVECNHKRHRFRRFRRLARTRACTSFAPTSSF